MGDERINTGYGRIYKNVFEDENLTIEAKAIYGYLCSFAGNGCTCFPSSELMRKKLKIGNQRFYTHMKILEERGFVTKKQIRNGGKWGKCIYAINHFPDEPLHENQTSEPLHEKPLYEKPLYEKPTNNNNSINNNSINNNRDIINYVCDLFNEVRSRKSSKGRLKANTQTAISAINILVKSGFTDAEIREAANELARMDMESKGNDFLADWYKLEKYILGKRKRSI